jgi:hypothetical protein
MNVELILNFNPADKDEVAQMADTLGTMLSGLLGHGVSPTVKAPVLGPVLASAAQAPPLPDKGTRTRRAGGNGTAAKPGPGPEPGPLVEADDDDPLGGGPVADVPPTGEYTVPEKLEASRAVLRQAYLLPDGGVQAVKQLQKSMKVTKFSDVPPERADELFSHCREIAKRFSIDVPAPGTL